MRARPFILIIDDTELNIKLLTEMLKHDYDVKGAASGPAGFELIASYGAPDLVLLDVMMSGMDGHEICCRLKADPAMKHVPIMFVTANNDPVDEAYGLRLGAMDYITKPFHTAILRARVQNLIDLKFKTDLLESLAMLDGLTNIPNRRRFDEALTTEWARAQRIGSRIGLVMVDVDYFKSYNDFYGHGAGDVCLKKVAISLAESADRPADLVARYGGEEFVIL